MYYLDADDPYQQSSLPYQPYKGRTDPLLSQQQEVISPFTTPRAGSLHNTTARPSQAAPVPPRMSKSEALTFVRTCKKWLLAGSVIAFGILGGLVAGHVTGTTSNQVTPASNAPATSPSSGGGFFQQQQGQQQGGGYGFGNGNTWQPPVSSSRVS